MNELTLYYKSTCPYCAKVLNFMRQNKIELSLKNTAESPVIKQELLEVGGKPQVPCLVIDGKAKYESDDIIVWMKDNLLR